ncbi:heavy-metal-associated domain-containing protein [Sphingosinicella humi]|uniref:Copper chaperone n=1 Tax=Allosphingosinicella humi TaxID=2068657 RepID=A0A2U2J0V5_9SPHN|nr:heavy metal-associated domain-containing protein [Sphingosinicella humi]PWG01958.1 copper chaperone [Sphingosinicella humi]
MINFRVLGMTCGGCARAVTNAVQRVDENAKVDVDLGAKRVSVQSSADPKLFESAIGDAGYEVSLLPA